jgi:hypothetical protein
MTTTKITGLMTLELTRVCLHDPRILMLILLSFDLVGVCSLLAFPFCEFLEVYSKPVLSTLPFFPLFVHHLSTRFVHLIPSLVSYNREYLQTRTEMCVLPALNHSKVVFVSELGLPIDKNLLSTINKNAY